jgi:hypothetical protein
MMLCWKKIGDLLNTFPIISNAEPNASETSISFVNDNLPVTDSSDISLSENRNVNIKASVDVTIPTENIDKPPNKKEAKNENLI